MRTLSDGTKVEETFCYDCRNAVRYSLYASDYNKDNELDDIFSNLIHGGVTPPKSSVY